LLEIFLANKNRVIVIIAYCFLKDKTALLPLSDYYLLATINASTALPLRQIMQW
jgi:hypothetical protein